MKKKHHIQTGLLTFIIASAMILSCFGWLSFPIRTEALASRSVAGRLGLQHMSSIVLDDTDVPVYHGTVNKSSSVYSGISDSYSTNYIYNQLTSAERKFWDGLDAVCYKLLTTTKDAYSFDYRGSRYYSTEYVEYPGISSDQALDILYLFKYSNPQYYFLDTLIWSSGDSKAITLYDAFADGDARATATAEFTSTADTIISSAASLSSDEAKVRYFQKVIADRTTYDSEADRSDFRVYDNPYHQSAYSVFCDDHAVCAGYSMAMAYLCNGAGIDCTCVTSSGHQWNQVRLDDNWYNIDVTWADNDDSPSDIYYEYYLKSDSSYLSDRANASAHTPEDLWYGYLRSCVLDSSADGYSAGGIPTVYSNAEDPLIIGSDGNYIITCSTSGSRIYYTTDGSTPSEASTRCYKYSGGLSVSDPSGIRAIAVADGYRQSGVSSYAVPGQEDDNGSGDEGSEEVYPSEGTQQSTVTLTKPAIKKLVNRKTRKVVVKLSGLGQGDGYQIAYSTSKSSIGTKKKVGTSTTVNIRNLKKGKTYYVRVRTYSSAGGKTVYSKWSAVKKIKVTK